MHVTTRKKTSGATLVSSRL